MMLRRFQRDTKGGLSLIAAIVVPVMIGAGAFAVDISYYHVVENRLQTAADAAALAAVREVRDSVSGAVVTAVALAADNVPVNYGDVTRPSDVVIGVYDAVLKTFNPGGEEPNAVQVTAIRDTDHENAAPRFLSVIFGQEAVPISVTAVAVIQGPRACVIALDPWATGAIKVTGGGTITVPGCDVHTNSWATKSIWARGTSGITARRITTHGWVSGSNFSPEPLINQPAIADPLAAVPEPTVPAACSFTDLTLHSPQSFPAGTRFCGDTTIQGGGRLNLEPGIHYFTGGTLQLRTTTEIVADNVMMYFDETANLDSAANGEFRITAPQTGTYKGIAIFQSRAPVSPIQFTFTGGTDFFVDGTIYLPRGDIDFFGDVSIENSDAGYLIANTFQLNGNADLVFENNGVVATGMAPHAVLVD